VGRVKIRWLELAMSDLRYIAEYLAEYDDTAARRTVRTIREAVGQLAHHPEMGRPGRVSGTRELVIAGTPFLVPYRVRKGTVEVLSVLHSSRKWPDEF
jgi:toxin ParE1/3/4